jgi:hypothetical protein
MTGLFLFCFQLTVRVARPSLLPVGIIKNYGSAVLHACDVDIARVSATIRLQDERRYCYGKSGAYVFYASPRCRSAVESPIA